MTAVTRKYPENGAISWSFRSGLAATGGKITEFVCTSGIIIIIIIYFSSGRN